MSVPTWQFILTDINGAALGDLVDANDRVVTLPLNRIPTAAFSIRADHPLGSYFLDTQFDGYLKCYRNGTLVYIGWIVSSEEAPDTSTGTQRIAVTSAGPLWRYNFRMLGTTPAGFQAGSTASPINLGDLFNFVLDAFINVSITGTGHDDWFSGMSFGAHTVTSTGAVGVYYFKPFSDVLAEAAVGNFDFEVVPQEPTFTGGHLNPTIGRLYMHDVIGATHNEVVFEYGSPGSNLTSYGRVIDRSNLCNNGFIQQPAAADHSGILSLTDDFSVQHRGWFDGLVDDGGVEWDVLRLKLVENAVALRKDARQVITIQPKPNASYSALDDFAVGDTVQVRSVLNNNTILDAAVRIWGVTFNIDKEGNETQTLQTVNE